MRTSRIIDRLTGKGNVEREGEVICEVDYEIIVSQSSNQSTSSAQTDTENSTNPQDSSHTLGTRGRLRVLEGKRNLMEGALTLRLNDGRNWKFTVTNGNPVSALYMVIQAGDDSLAPAESTQ